MHRTYIWYSKVDMLEKKLGLSLLGKHVKPGALVLAVLSMSLSIGMHLKIYRELNTLLLDISVSISRKEQLIFPMEHQGILFKHLELSGGAWQGRSVDSFERILLASQVREDILILLTPSSAIFRPSLISDISAISKKGSSAYIKATLMERSTDSMSVAELYQFLPIPVGLMRYWLTSLLNYSTAIATIDCEALDKILLN